MDDNRRIVFVGIVTYALSIVLLFVGVVFLLRFAHMDFEPYPEILPAARLAAIIVTGICIASPMFFTHKYWSNSRLRSRRLRVPEYALPFFMRAMFGMIPTLCGFFVYELGASVVEFLIFAVVSCVAIIGWSIFTAYRDASFAPRSET